MVAKCKGSRWLLRSTNLSQCVNVGEQKIFGMKTHDCHVFLERLLPLVMRELLPKKVSNALIELSNFLKELHSKVRKNFYGWRIWSKWSTQFL